MVHEADVTGIADGSGPVGRSRDRAAAGGLDHECQAVPGSLFKDMSLEAITLVRVCANHGQEVLPPRIQGVKRIQGCVVRRALSVSAVVALASVSACGGTTEESGDSGASPSPSPPSPSSSATGGESGAGQAGSAADGKCGGGELETKVVEAAQGIEVTVPGDWEVESFRAGFQNRLYPPDRDVGDGYLVIEPSVQTLDEAADEVLKGTRAAAETTSEQDLDLRGFDGARMVTFAYDDETFAVNVVAVYQGFRLKANMTREGVPEEQAVVESCLSSISRSS